MKNNVEGIEVTFRSADGYGYILLAPGDFSWVSTASDAPPFNRSECHFERVTLHFRDGAFRSWGNVHGR